MKKPTERFSNRVENYIKYRPTYPKAILWFLAQTCDLTTTSVVADLGSGTGLLTQLFLEQGNPVYGVEPNPDMRAAAEQHLIGYDNFTSIAGQAEATTLPPASVDFVTAGQAFHWFEVAPTQQEVARILRPGGWIVLIWNSRQMDDPFHQAYDQMLRTHAPEYEAVQAKHVNEPMMQQFFEGLCPSGQFQTETFENGQMFDLDGLKGRLLSCSYAPTPEQAEYAPMMTQLEDIFEQYAAGGRLRFEYQTQVFYGQFRNNA